jgi:AcrR family transcriptional regulator
MRMKVEADPAPAPRLPLSRERVLRAAIGLADADGIGSLTMRRLAQELGVEAMTLYYYVANKDELLNGAVDLVLGEIELPTRGADWKAEIRKTAISEHDVLVRHPWASARMLSSGLTPARLEYMESILGTLRAGGFSPWQTHLAYHALESHIVGFTLWLAGMALPDDLTDVATAVLREVPEEEFPAFVEHIHEHLKPHTGDEEDAFEFGLDLILDGLERMLTSRR